MMPSRGLRLSKAAVAPRLATQVQCRNISSHPLRHVLRRNGLSSRSSPFAHAAPGAGIVLLSSVRHASTTPSAPTAAATAAPAAASEPASFPNLDTITLDNIVPEAIANGTSGPGQVGYLHALGIDTGYGPSSCLQWVLEHIHVYADLPWWAAILTTAVGLRLALAPLFVRASDSMARSVAVTSVTKPHQERMQAAQKVGDSATAWAELRAISAVRKRAGVSFTAQFLPAVVQGVLGYCGYNLTHKLAALPVPEFPTAGFLWITDLTATDGFLILPAVLAGSMHLLMRSGGESGGGMTKLPRPMRLIMLYGLPAGSFLFMAFQPAAVVLWFAGTGLLGMAQGMALRVPRVRSALGIAPILQIEGASAGVMADVAALSGARMDADAAAPSRSTVGNLAAPYTGLTAGGREEAAARPTPVQRTFRYQAPQIKTRTATPSAEMPARGAGPGILDTTATRKFDGAKAATTPPQDGTALAEAARVVQSMASGELPAAVAAASTPSSTVADPSRTRGPVSKKRTSTTASPQSRKKAAPSSKGGKK